VSPEKIKEEKRKKASRPIPLANLDCPERASRAPSGRLEGLGEREEKKGREERGRSGCAMHTC